MGKKPSFYNENRRQLLKLCDELGFEYEFMDPQEQQCRVYGATHVIDIWPSRMTFHRISGETIRSKEPYPRGMMNSLYGQNKFKFDRERIKSLLERGEI